MPSFLKPHFIKPRIDALYASSKLLQQDASTKNLNLGQCFKTCRKNCIKKCHGTPIAKKLQKEIFNFTTNQGNDIEINKQIKALKKTLLFFEPKKNN